MTLFIQHRTRLVPSDIQQLLLSVSPPEVGHDMNGIECHCPINVNNMFCLNIWKSKLPGLERLESHGPCNPQHGPKMRDTCHVRNTKLQRDQGGEIDIPSKNKTTKYRIQHFIETIQKSKTVKKHLRSSST